MADVIDKNRNFGNGYKVVIKGKTYPLIKTSMKSVYYLKDKKEKRTSIFNVERVIEPPKRDTTGFHNFGGHVPYVPETCDHPKIFEYEGIRWIDNQICYNVCKVKKCDRWREYRKEMNQKFKK